jgi:hypothetical protein
MMTTAFAGGLWFVLATWRGLEAGWAAPVAGAMASMALWWVKEFGSDLPNVAAELRRACDDRRLQGACAAPPEMTLGYWRDGEWDCRTDGLFYFAGAWIGAGLLSSSATLTADGAAGAWRSGAEIIGLLLFVAIFLLLGRNWARRQQAIDMTGAPRASRLALFGSRLTLAVQDGGTWRCEPTALRTLHAFATALPTDGAPFDHLVIVGAPGSGKSVLGHALATEAALVGLPASFAPLSAMLGLTDHEPTKRSRVVTAEHLASIPERYLARQPYQARDLQANPVVTLFLRNDADDPGLRSATRHAHEAPRDADRIDGAELVVVTDMRRGMAAEDLEKVFEGLAPAAPILPPKGREADGSNRKQTVWLIENGPPVAGQDACAVARDGTLTEFIASHLRPRLEGPCGRWRVAIAHVARDCPPGL